MKVMPEGIGIWIWKVSNCENGNWDKIIEKCKASGVKWIAVKAGENTRSLQWSKDIAATVIDKCHKNNIKIYGWNYSYPKTYMEQVIFITDCMNQGLDGWIIDAETEWEFEPNSNAKAEAFMTMLRSSVGDAFIAHAPFTVIEYHSGFPYVGFGKYVDAVMPQSYWVEFNWTVQRVVTETDRSWKNFNAKHPEAAKPVWPIGVTYGKGYPGVAGTFNPDDLKKFIEHYKDKPISLYSFDASKNFSAWEVLKSMKEDELPEPDPIPEPDLPDTQPDVPSGPDGSSGSSPTNPGEVQNPLVPNVNIFQKIVDVIKLILRTLFHIK